MQGVLLCKNYITGVSGARGKVPGEPKEFIHEGTRSWDFFIFVPFCLVLSHFGPHGRGLVRQEEGVLSLGRVVIFNVIATKAGTSTSAHRGSRLRGNNEKGRLGVLPSI